mmetsp:Transcript_1394/g.2541  ORF Transcript_1394/g.2541 Transcript_1394/m.2541 type:complete len:242 (+) Transcript_1394:156-881(+)
MRLSTILAISMFSSTTAFAPQMPLHSTHHRVSPLGMSTEAVNYIITGNNIEVTEALNNYVNKKLDNVIGKLSGSGAVKECDVHLSVNKNPKVKNGHTCEVVTFVKGTVIRCAEESDDMYASIDAVTDRLAKKLRKYKERRLEGYHGGPNMGENLAEVLDSLPVVEDEAAAPAKDEEFVDPEAPVVTKIKSYDLSKPISIEEAIFALGYVDHDFYVFREEETNEINVVYKRNAGGYGLIAPQ